jgi:cytoskeletal protein CcmA (bactofilin family)
VERENINLITAGSRFEGTVEFTDYTRFEGYVHGTLKGGVGSELIVGENGVVEGKVEGDVVVIDGFVRGDIKARSKVVISGTGRVVGEIVSPSISIEFGGFFDGKCSMGTMGAPPVGNA